MYDAFLSYGRKDGLEFALRVKHALQDRGKRIWLDEESVLPAVAFRPELRAGIEAADAFLIVVTEHSMSEESFCRLEIEHAVSLGKRIVPLVAREFGPAPLPRATPAAIAELNIVHVSPGASFARDIERVLEGLELDLPWIREHTRLTLRASEWLAHERNQSWLLRGDDLAASEVWLGRAEAPVDSPTSTARKRDAQPTALQRELIEASRIRRAREHDDELARRLELRARAAFERRPGSLPLAARLAVESMRLVQSRTAYRVLRDCLDLLPRPIARVDHEAPIRVVAASAGGRIATCDASGGVRVTDVSSGRLLWQQRGPGEICCAEFSSDGSSLAIGDEMGVVVVYAALDGRSHARFEHGERISSARFSVDGRYVLTTVGHGLGPAVRGPSIVRTWQIEARRMTSEMAHDDLVDAWFHPVLRVDGGPVVVSGAHAGQYWIRDVHGGEVGHGPAAEDEQDSPCAIAVDPVRPTIALTGMRGRLRCIALAQGGRTMSSEIGTDSGCVAFSPRGQFLAVSAGDGTVLVWEVESWTLVARLPAPHAHTLLFGPDELTLATVSLDEGVRLWRLAPSREIGRIATEGSGGLAFVPDRAQIVAARRDSGSAWVFDLRDDSGWRPHAEGHPLRLHVGRESGRVAIGGECPDPTTPWISASRPRPGFVAWADPALEQRELLCSTSRMVGSIRVRRSADELLVTDGAGASVLSIGARARIANWSPAAALDCVATSPCGSRVAASSVAGELWSWTTDGSEAKRVACAGEIASVALAESGRVLAARTRDGRTIHLWRDGEPTVFRSISVGPAVRWPGFANIAVSHDGAWLAAAVEARVEVYECVSGRLVGRITHDASPLLLEFAPDVKSLVSTSSAALGDPSAIGDMRVWDLPNDRLRIEATLESPVLSLAFSADSERVACGMEHGEVALWDVAGGEELCRLRTGDGRSAVRAVAFSPDGRWLYTLAGALVRLWAWRPEELVDEVRRRNVMQAVEHEADAAR